MADVKTNSATSSKIIQNNLTPLKAYLLSAIQKLSIVRDVRSGDVNTLIYP